MYNGNGRAYQIDRDDFVRCLDVAKAMSLKQHRALREEANGIINGMLLGGEGVKASIRTTAVDIAGDDCVLRDYGLSKGEEDIGTIVTSALLLDLRSRYGSNSVKQHR